MTRLRTILVLLATFGFALPAASFVGTADHPVVVECAAPLDETCPDLIVDGDRFKAYLQTRTFSSNSCAVQEGTTQPGTRTLLRFTFTTPNIGVTDLVVGNPAGNPAFEYGSCHGHYHFKQYADYRLWTPEQFAAWDALRAADPNTQAHEILEAHPELQPVRGDKRGFCVIDIIRYELLMPGKWTSCSFQGISPGWADEYDHRLDGQWVDVTGVPRGTYVLEAEVNAEHLYHESDYANNRAWRTVTI